MSCPSTRSSVGRLSIDLAAIRANYRSIAGRAAPAAVGAVVKADAYGLGARKVAPALAREGCRDFFVAHLREAEALVGALPADGRVFVLNGLAPGDEARCAALGAVPVLNALPQVRAWAALGLPAALQIDSGMARMGLSGEDIETLAQDSDLLGRLDLRLVMSHLASGDEPDSPLNAEQLACFLALASRLPPAPRSLANSGGAFLGRDFSLDLVRPGVALYGAAPHAGGPGLAPAVRLGAGVIQIRDVPAQTGVGYGHAYRSAEAMRLATVGIGYADGWPRQLGGRDVAAWFEGVRLPMVGRVSMDSIVVDIGALPNGALEPGDEVELIGPHQSLDDVAAQAGTVAHDLLTGLGQRLDRFYLGDQP
ncbi:MAG: alr [Caulobacter sp.]|nr:alr [Caulobacter sp.]